MKGKRVKLIESGWRSYRHEIISKAASDVQISETRQAFYAGAALLFHSIMKILEPGDEPTDADLEVMTSIQAELDQFGVELDAKYLGNTGKA